MNSKKRSEILLGLIMLLVGIGYLWATTTVPRKDHIDASFVPYALGVLCSLLGVLQLLSALRLAASSNVEEEGLRVDYATVAKTVVLIVGYVALLSYVGFPIMTTVYLLAQLYVLTPNDQQPRWLLYGCVAVASSVAIYLLFRDAFDLMLPLGWLETASD